MLFCRNSSAYETAPEADESEEEAGFNPSRTDEMLEHAIIRNSDLFFNIIFFSNPFAV
jgi:hypothetical protein